MTAVIFDSERVAAATPGEPERGARGPGLMVRLAVRGVAVVLLAVCTLPLWPIYWLGLLVYGRAPNVPRVSQVARYLADAWTVRPPAPGMPLLWRAWLTLSCLRKLAVTPIWGLAWMLDEVFYGRALRAVTMQGPLFEISAARSGSTQLARYVEADEMLLAPTASQSVFPYLWLWRLVPRTLGRIITEEAARAKMFAALPPEFLERHEADPFRMDTFDVALYVSHLNVMSPMFGPKVAVREFNSVVRGPHNQALWTEDFVRLTDGIGRKLMVLHGEDGTRRRLFVKGHFLNGADALEAHYPDARFFTMVRDPASRFQSAGNFVRANPFDHVLPPVPWPWVGPMLVGQIAYCEAEQEWFSRDGGARRCVLRFEDYVADLPGTLARIYDACLDHDVPPQVTVTHERRKRSGYTVDRSLEEMGIDEAALNDRLQTYRAWASQFGQK